MVIKNRQNRNVTVGRICSCGRWKQHWLNYSNEQWSSSCSVSGCTNQPTFGAHIINANVLSEKVVPMCVSCNNKTEFFDR